MAQKKNSMSLKVAIFGALGVVAIAYAIRRPKNYLFDGFLASCEGAGEDCYSVYVQKKEGSGEVFAPFSGKFVVSGNSWTLDHSGVVLYGTFSSGSFGSSRDVKEGDLLGHADSIQFKMHKLDEGPIATSAFLLTHGKTLTNHKGKSWCENDSKLVLPKCDKDFLVLNLPKYSIKPMQVTQ